MKTIIILTATLALAAPSFASVNSAEVQNKKTVEAFYDLAFNKHKPEEAMKLYTGEKYIQHNPFVGDGKQPFIDFFGEYYYKNPEASVQVKRMIADGDLVVVHTHSKQKKEDRGTAVVDIFRLKLGKIVEHWDVVQPIPEKAANNNTMF